MASTQQPDLRLVFCTCPVDHANRIATSLVEARVAACVNILPTVQSVYRWKGQIENEAESLLLIKCAAFRFAELVEKIESEHPYDVPEVVSFDVAEGNSAYVDWALANCRPAASGDAADSAPNLD